MPVSMSQLFGGGSVHKLLLSTFLLILSLAALGSSTKHHRKWDHERSKRNNKIKKHFEKYPDEARVFISGSNGVGIMPMTFFRLFQDLFPDIWGDQLGNYDLVGLAKNIFEKNNPLPLGMAYEKITGNGKFELNKVGFTCLACHTGQYQDLKGEIHPIVGAPNTRIDNPAFLMAKTALHKNFTAKKIINALKQKPIGWIYNDPNMISEEKVEREFIYNLKNTENIVKEIKTFSQGLIDGKKFIQKFTHTSGSSPDSFAPKRGSMNVLFTTYLAYFKTGPSASDLKDIMPKSSAEVDAPSIWLQRNRGADHWDGSTTNRLHRNVGAAASMFNKPVNLKNIKKITSFLSDFPPAPYPFKVNMKMAKRGKKIFAKNCLSCHQSQNQVFPYEEVGTDEHRFLHLTKNASKFLGQLLAGVCSDPSVCSRGDGRAYLAEELATESRGYVGGRLDGIWARAPYLHNGSVPTLKALLTGERPRKFYRGSTKYDQKNVGFEWRIKKGGTVVYDTSLQGNSNKGHDSTKYLGIDWKKNPKKLKYLLEYLKTL